MINAKIGLDWLWYLAGKSSTAPSFFVLFNTLIFIYFFKHETIETHARAFLTLIILAIGRVALILATLRYIDS